MSDAGDIEYNGVIDLICDAVFQLKLATECSNSYRMNRHARASIISSVFAIESVANALVESLELGSRIKSDLDKLPVLSKFEMFARLSDSVIPFDRGRVEMQRVQELVQLRNDFVHPKTKPIPTDALEFVDHPDGLALPLEMTGQQYQSLGIPKRPMFWSADNAKTAFLATVEFLRHVISDVAGMSPVDAECTLHSRLRIGDATVIVTFDEFRSELMALDDFEIDLSFLGILPAARID